MKYTTNKNEAARILTWNDIENILVGEKSEAQTVYLAEMLFV